MKPKVPTAEQLISALESDEYAGWCVACGEEAEGVEPDAAHYECESCGERAVFGAEELLVRGAYLEEAG